MDSNAGIQDPYIGQSVTDYCITEFVGAGKIGRVYKAVRKDPRHELACKVIPEGKLKDGWQREIQKVAQLIGVPNIVQYYSHGEGKGRDDRPFTYVLFNFIQGTNLWDYLKNPSLPLDLTFVQNLADTILRALLACRAVNIQHGDLHEGNILISEPDTRLYGSPRTVWISDFGYGGSHNNIEPKDDYKQLVSIVLSLLTKIERSDLNPRDRVLQQKMKEFFRRKVLEVDPTQGSYVGNPEELLKEFTALGVEAERESAAAYEGKEKKEPGDYLWAEALGFRKDEWKHLFVPEFLAAQDLLSRNITVLTGARGCGKTMAFRRLTALMDQVIGEPSGVRGSDQFIGFYLNCRDLTEAFPWIPPKTNVGIEQQIIHFFHLAWFAEILKTLGAYDPDRLQKYEWLDKFVTEMFSTSYRSLPQGADILSHVRAFIEDEKEKCRISDLGKSKGYVAWPLARIDSLDMLHQQLAINVSWIGGKLLYFFLDDYTIPIVPRQVQKFLNQIIFKRRSNLFFKVSTEATNSFVREGLRQKPLELHQDFELIDLATESLHQNEIAKARLLDKIFRPRIDRHPVYHGQNSGLIEVLGKTPFSSNQLARQMRSSAQKGGKKSVVYWGASAFLGMWSSDIRTMIQMLTDMLREANGSIKKGQLQIEPSIQNKWYRAAGGEFLVFAESVRDPSYWEKGPSSTVPGERYGTHLRNVVEAFVNVSRFELTLGALVSNQERINPKQAFRLEIIDKLDLSASAIKYYQGLVRWHIFLQDWRGKSVRGMITPRLYLNRILIPYSYLTFSSHDNIHLSNQEFISLLVDPKHFLKYWKAKRQKGKRTSAKSDPTLWD